MIVTDEPATAFPQFALGLAHDVDALAARFAEIGRVRIHEFLDAKVAGALHARLDARQDWRQLINSGDKLFELDRATRAGMSAARMRDLDDAVWQGARSGFQYRYESLRLPDGNRGEAADATGNSLGGLTHWLSTGTMRDILRRITGAVDVDYADGQATAYSSGDFLTGHDDAVAGKRRRAAYVIGLTPVWRVEWGGLLLFHGADGAVSGHMPGFNTLDVFAVPQMHSVSPVAPAAACRRLAITGWLRAADDRAGMAG
ncbi:2OG-Fe(II) oxygenase [Sphingomonas solaris]|uniref:Proline hydroxylase n=1 Tax=Alterirhizorhabdus solaris TaxID=2529389 RepID=A0A558R564_9SPHN|nr:2OG-Fe(II) oxygenase family protein [Sphingomonas solaris]TVV74499.1 proline hydroxylase [Sphingomonas solaris]